MLHRFTKTTRGREVIFQHDFSLSRAARALLILTDGERSVTDMTGFLGKPEAEIAALYGELVSRKLVEPVDAINQYTDSFGQTRQLVFSRLLDSADLHDRLLLAKYNVLGVLKLELGTEIEPVMGAFLQAQTLDEFWHEMALCHQLLLDLCGEEEATRMMDVVGQLVPSPKRLAA